MMDRISDKHYSMLLSSTYYIISPPSYVCKFPIMTNGQSGFTQTFKVSSNSTNLYMNKSSYGLNMGIVR